MKGSIDVSSSDKFALHGQTNFRMIAILRLLFSFSLENMVKLINYSYRSIALLRVFVASNINRKFSVGYKLSWKAFSYEVYKLHKGILDGVFRYAALMDYLDRSILPI